MTRMHDGLHLVSLYPTFLTAHTTVRCCRPPDSIITTGLSEAQQWLHSQQLLIFFAYTHTRRGSFVAREIAGSAAALVLLLRSQERTASAATTQMSTIGPIWSTFT